jgi:hypothetical protein
VERYFDGEEEFTSVATGFHGDSSPSVAEWLWHVVSVVCISVGEDTNEEQKDLSAYVGTWYFSSLKDNTNFFAF